MIICSAKEAGDSDSFTAYRTHLETPRVVHDDGSEITQSVVEKVSERRIAGRRWIIGRHLNSELLDYRTWYFATIADDIAVLVTFSAHRDFAEAYLEDVETALENLTLTKPVKNQ